MVPTVRNRNREPNGLRRDCDEEDDVDEEEGAGMAVAPALWLLCARLDAAAAPAPSEGTRLRRVDAGDNRAALLLLFFFLLLIVSWSWCDLAVPVDFEQRESTRVTGC